MTAGTAIRITVHDSDGAEISRSSFPGPQVRIGRVEASSAGRNDIVLPDDAVSRDHAYLLLQGATVNLIDLGSRNGTLVNGQMVQERRTLQPGDSVGIGPFLLRCDAAASAALPDPLTEPGPAGPSTVDFAPVDTDLPDFDFAIELGVPDTSPDVTDTAPPPVAPDTLPPRVSDAPQDLAGTYRALAQRHGAPAWGRPAALGPGDGTAVLTSLRAVVREPLWPERLADELCATGPLAALLDDRSVTAITVAGTGPIQVRRGAARELASARFSCVEALFACHERWTGARLADAGSSTRQLSPQLSVVTVGRDLAPGGPVLHIVRSPPPSRGLSGLGLPPAAVALLEAAVDRRARLIVYGDATAELGDIAAALAVRRAPELLTVRIARSAPWPFDPTLVTLAGHQPGALRAAREFHPDWLIVDELATGDLLELRAALAAPVGAVATMHARSAEAALQRLAAGLASASGGEAPACRAELAHALDFFVAVRPRGGQPRITSICELRPGDRGELVELFLLKPDHASLEATGVEPQVLRERSL